MSMAGVILDEQLYRNYSELAYLILQCYKDIAVLNYFIQLGEKKEKLQEEVLLVAEHYIKLVQRDLALTIWKIKIDTNSNANTVSQFRNKINQLMKNNNLCVKQVKAIKLDKKIRDDINYIRSRYLAHTDMNRQDSKIEISDLKKALDDICTEFNNICRVIDDERVYEITPADKMTIDIKFSMGISHMLSE